MNHHDQITEVLNFIYRNFKKKVKVPTRHLSHTIFPDGRKVDYKQLRLVESALNTAKALSDVFTAK